jgi:amino acid transporter
VYTNPPEGSLHVSADWLNPFAIDSTSALINGVLLGLFIYWGWDSGVAVNEESEDSASGPGKAAVVSTLLLVGIYVVVAIAAQAYAGTQALVDNADDVLSYLGGRVFPEPLDLLLIIAVLTSASASTQTTILPTARTTLSMARWGALNKAFGQVHPRYQTPSFSTILMGVMSVTWFVVIVNVSANILEDSIVALGFLIAFYYGLTGFACAVYYRRELKKSARNFFMLGFLPALGGLLLLGIFAKALIYYGDPANSSSPGVLGIGVPVVVGIGSMLVGVIVLLVTRSRYLAYFRRPREVADPALLTDGGGAGAG